MLRRPSSLSLALAALVALTAAGTLVACGGGGGGTPTNPSTPPPTTQPPATATPTPTPSPTATPYDCDRETLAAGPVAQYRFKLKVIRRNGDFIEGPPEGDPFPTDSEGRILVQVGDFLVFDSTQKNAGGEQCQWQNDPVWSISDTGIFSERTDASRETTACGFLLRGDVIRKGVFEIDAMLDGVDGDTVYGHDPVLVLKSE